MIIILAFVWFLALTQVRAVELYNLEANQLDLTLAANAYAAVLFADKSQAGSELSLAWAGAAELLESLPDDATLAIVDGTDVELKEVVEAYGITVPSIRVFRRGVMGDYRGPSKGGSAQAIADYISEDAKVGSVSLSLSSVYVTSSLGS